MSSHSTERETVGVMENMKALALTGETAVAFSLNCSGMYRGVIRGDGVPLTAIFFDEEMSRL